MYQITLISTTQGNAFRVQIFLFFGFILNTEKFIWLWYTNNTKCDDYVIYFYEIVNVAAMKNDETVNAINAKHKIYAHDFFLLQNTLNANVFVFEEAEDDIKLTPTNVSRMIEKYFNCFSEKKIHNICLYIMWLCDK